MIDQSDNTNQPKILNGIAASPGKTKGIVKVVRKIADLVKIEDGDVFVAGIITPDYVPALRKASAVITDYGEVTSHGTIIAKELGLPAVIGTKNSTAFLQDGDVVEVDGDRGIVTKL